MQKGFDFMVQYVKDYIDSDTGPMSFDMDFAHFLGENHPAMERKNQDAAEGLVFYLFEDGVETADGLTDAQHKRLIRKQFKAFIEALADGMW